jgi:hypothetical protein
MLSIPSRPSGRWRPTFAQACVVAYTEDCPEDATGG